MKFYFFVNYSRFTADKLSDNTWRRKVMILECIIHHTWWLKNISASAFVRNTHFVLMFMYEKLSLVYTNRGHHQRPLSIEMSQCSLSEYWGKLIDFFVRHHHQRHLAPVSVNFFVPEQRVKALCVVIGWRPARALKTSMCGLGRQG